MKEKLDTTSLCHPLTRAGYSALRNAETKPETRIPVDFFTEEQRRSFAAMTSELPWLRSGLSNKLSCLPFFLSLFPTDSSKKNFSRCIANRKYQPPHRKLDRFPSSFPTFLSLMQQYICQFRFYV